MGLRRRDAGKTWKSLVVGRNTGQSYTAVLVCWDGYKHHKTGKVGGGVGFKSGRRQEKSFGPLSRMYSYVFVADAPVRSHVEVDISAEFAVILLVMSRSLN